MEIKEGMIAVTKDRLYIADVTEVTPKHIYGKFQNSDYHYIIDIDKYDFYKEPIDLIKEGDYVNGYLINYITSTDGHKEVWHDAHDVYDSACFRNKDIKSIVTKEQFEKISYKVVQE